MQPVDSFVSNENSIQIVVESSMAKINVIFAIVNREDVASADVLTLYWMLCGCE